MRRSKKRGAPSAPARVAFCDGHPVLVSLGCLKTYASKRPGRVRRLAWSPTSRINRKCRPQRVHQPLLSLWSALQSSAAAVRMCDSARTDSAVDGVGQAQVGAVCAPGCGLDRCPSDCFSCKQDVQESRSRRRESLCRATLRLRLSRPCLLQVQVHSSQVICHQPPSASSQQKLFVSPQLLTSEIKSSVCVSSSLPSPSTSPQKLCVSSSSSSLPQVKFAAATP